MNKSLKFKDRAFKRNSNTHQHTEKQENIDWLYLKPRTRLSRSVILQK